MTHKDFLTELHKASKLDRQQVSALVSSLIRILTDEAISGKVVEIEGLGQFISHKHPEYVKTNEETGESVLYPPRISYRFSALKNFASANTVDAALAEYTGLEASEISLFLACFVSTIILSVNNGEEVEILGLGKFVLVDPQNGEMRRIALMLSDKMKQEVNAPFSVFEPYVISKGNPLPEKPNEEVMEENAEPEPEEQVELEEEETKPEIMAEPKAEAENQEVESEQEEEDDDIDRFSTIISRPKKQPQTYRPQKKYWIYTLLSGIGILCLIIGLCVWIFWPSSDDNVWPIRPENGDIPTTFIPEKTQELSQEENIEQEVEVVETEPQAGPVVEEKSVREENPKPVVESKPEQKVEPAPVVEQPTPKPVAAGRRMKDSSGKEVTVVVEKGDRLTLIALKNFGSKDFWPYIFDVNTDKLKSPNSVAVGMRLYLPDPVYFDIDSLSESSIKKARLRARELNK